MATELRSFGDGKTIVLYTTSNKVGQRLKNSVRCLNVIPYEQDQYSRKRIGLIGIDLYFDKKNKNWLLGQLKILGEKITSSLSKLELSPQPINKGVKNLGEG